MLVLNIFSAVNQWNGMIAGIPTDQPFQNILLIMIIGVIMSILFMSFLFPVAIGYIKTLINKSNSKFSYFGIINGVSLGLLLLGIMVLINNFAPSLSPKISNYSSANHYLPFLGMSIESTLRFH